MKTLQSTTGKQLVNAHYQNVNIFSHWFYGSFGFEGNIACVARVSVGFGSKERDFWYFASAENGERAKNESWADGLG